MSALPAAKSDTTRDLQLDDDIGRRSGVHKSEESAIRATVQNAPSNSEKLQNSPSSDTLKTSFSRRQTPAVQSAGEPTKSTTRTSKSPSTAKVTGDGTGKGIATKQRTIFSTRSGVAASVSGMVSMFEEKNSIVPKLVTSDPLDQKDKRTTTNLSRAKGVQKAEDSDSTRGWSVMKWTERNGAAEQVTSASPESASDGEVQCPSEGFTFCTPRGSPHADRHTSPLPQRRESPIAISAHVPMFTVKPSNVNSRKPSRKSPKKSPPKEPFTSGEETG